jgi:hypothetical protein
VSALGALAASLQALECGRLLAGAPSVLGSGGEVVVDAAHHRHYRTAGRRNPECRFDHATWSIEPLAAPPWVMTLRQAFGLGDGAEPGPRSLGVAGSRLGRTLVCSGCGGSRFTLRLASRPRDRAQRCRRCGGAVAVSGQGLTDRIFRSELEESRLDRTLQSVGVEPGDVLVVGDARGDRYFELPAASQPPRGNSHPGGES